jgi:hypothetical protein
MRPVVGSRGALGGERHLKHERVAIAERSGMTLILTGVTERNRSASSPRVLLARAGRRAARVSATLLESIGIDVVLVKDRHSTRRSLKLARRQGVVLPARTSGDRPVLDPYKYFTLKIATQAGISHLKSALTLLIKEAVLLNRTPVVFAPSFLPLHNFGRDVEAGWDKYLDLKRIGIAKGGMLYEIEALRAEDIGRLDSLAVLEVRGRHLITPPENRRYDLIVKQNSTGLGAESALAHKDFDFDVELRPSVPVRNAADAVRRQLGSYHAMHVRRGDKLTEARYPNLARDTSPAGIHATVSRVLPKGATIYILTDERTPHYFDVLKAEYRVVQYFDFPELKQLVAGDDPDNFFLYEIENLIFDGADTRIYTFAHPKGAPRVSLTRDVGWT